MKIVWRAGVDYDLEAASNEATIKDQGDSLTVQSMAEDADINVIMKRFGITGQMPEGSRMPEYGDYEGITDYRTAIHAVREAQESFNKYPANIRAKFDNDPQLFLDFVNDPKNAEEMVSLGLATRRPDANRTEGSSNQEPPKGKDTAGSSQTKA